jgi:hypothetical protein
VEVIVYILHACAGESLLLVKTVTTDAYRLSFIIRFGDEPGQYECVSSLPNPTGHIHEYTGVLNTEVKEMIKRSNMYFGKPCDFLRCYCS